MHEGGPARGDECDPRHDLELVRRTRERDAAATQELLTRLGCLARIVASLNARMGGPFDAHELLDVVQDVSVLVWKKLEAFDGIHSLESWVYGIARLELMNALRRKRRTPGRNEEAVEALEDPASDSPIDGELLRLGLERIDAVDANVLRLYHFEGLTLGEVARRLGVSASTIKTRYYRGLERLETVLSMHARARGKS